MIKSSSKSLFAMLSIIALIAGAQVSCGGESESAKIDFDPEKNPIAVNADLTIGTGTAGEDVVIEGPWYIFKYRISNSSKTATLKLVTFKFYVTGFKNGIKSTNEYSLDPGADCAETKSRAFTVIVPPQSTRSGYAADDSGEPLSHCDLEDQDPTKILDPDAGEFESWYIDGLPESSNLIYSIRIEGEGWFEEGGVITERAYISGFQVTR